MSTANVGVTQSSRSLEYIIGDAVHPMCERLAHAVSRYFAAYSSPVVGIFEDAPRLRVGQGFSCCSATKDGRLLPKDDGATDAMALEVLFGFGMKDDGASTATALHMLGLDGDAISNVIALWLKDIIPS